MKVEYITDLKYYALCDTTYIGDKISNTLRHFYWFAPTSVNQGEYVVLYTKKGQYSKTNNADGSVFHNFYWNSSSAIWNNSGDAALLFEIADWKTTKAK